MEAVGAALADALAVACVWREASETGSYNWVSSP